ncbi:MAG: hypothetical protein VB080_12500, partial [Propionicimonas sp.]|uniref:hypothetical protein n=1 Tax=Propionicimonas sp. TaxID=1955623 RepID=UPI002B1FA4B0
FRNFGNKSNLISAAIRQRVSNIETQSLRYTGDLEADLIRLATTYRDTWTAFGSSARILITAAVDPELAEIGPMMGRMFAVIRDLLGRYQEEGRLRSESGDSLLFAFLGPIAMPFVLAAVANGGSVPPLDVTAHVNRFLHGRLAGREDGDDS